MSQKVKREYYYYLDFMRFVCSLCVILHHSFQYLTTYPYLNHTHVVVDFFIMLGGFVATNADEPKLESGRITFRDFVRHRFLRLFPLMSVGVFLGSVFFILTHHDFRLPLIALVFAYAVLNLLIIPRLFGDYYIKEDNAVISNPPLSTIIYQTTITFIWARWFVGCRTRNVAAIVTISGVLFAISAYFTKELNVGWGGPHAIWGYLRTFYDFFAGVLIYRLRRYIPTSKVIPFFSFFVIIVIIFPPFSSVLWKIFTFYVMPPLALICGVSARGQHIVYGDKWFGRLSYSNYVTHWLVLYVIALAIPNTNNFAAVGLAVVLSVTVAFLTMKYYDIPISAWVNKKFDHKRREPLISSRGRQDVEA
ncbi:acyltransferase family protein [Acetobacter nitrogenifigens]|uniref:acyltransferase family protein n=1 Tax=Acetobacter nitrogenifigens TaxID=285268 RepID=UPI0004013F3D|nr:acyltransferase [Acetobacter nitrogenifigens]